MNRQLVSVTDAVPYQEFAKLIGKTPRAVRGMIEKGKLPVIEITDPQSVSGRAGEYWVYLPAWNNGLKLAYEIPAARRAAYPSATRCVSCQSVFEAKNKHYRRTA
ncbi:TPA: hypothetical protein H6395_003557 [Escherichia coli]|nr:Cox family DNA-binding protein [Escherichia coli]HAL7107494.1 hypothetical protein [Escherichia coli]